MTFYEKVWKKLDKIDKNLLDYDGLSKLRIALVNTDDNCVGLTDNNIEKLWNMFINSNGEHYIDGIGIFMFLNWIRG